MLGGGARIFSGAESPRADRCDSIALAAMSWRGAHFLAFGSRPPPTHPASRADSPVTSRPWRTARLSWASSAASTVSPTRARGAPVPRGGDVSSRGQQPVRRDERRREARRGHRLRQGQELLERRGARREEGHGEGRVQEPGRGRARDGGRHAGAERPRRGGASDVLAATRLPWLRRRREITADVHRLRHVRGEQGHRLRGRLRDGLRPRGCLERRDAASARPGRRGISARAALRHRARGGDERRRRHRARRKRFDLPGHRGSVPEEAARRHPCACVPSRASGAL